MLSFNENHQPLCQGIHSQNAPGDGMGFWIFTSPHVYSPIPFFLIYSFWGMNLLFHIWMC